MGRSMVVRASLVAAAVTLLLGGCRARGGDRPDPSGAGPAGSAGAPSVPRAADVDGTVRTPDGRERTWRAHVPASAWPGPAALVVALHGGLGNAAQFEASSGFDAQAEAAGFVVVYPDGIPIGGVAGAIDGEVWNGGTCCGPAVGAGVDDVAFVRSVIDEMERRYPIDPARVFATGHSNGGIMSYRLACELGDRIVAVAFQAGALGVPECRPARPVSLLHLHGTADRNVPLDGGRGAGLAGVDFVAAVDGVRTVARADGCADLDPPARRSSENPDVVVRTWTDCDGNAEVALMTVEGASHAWMGHPVAAERLVGEAYPRLDAAAVLWSFLAAHPRR